MARKFNMKAYQQDAIDTLEAAAAGFAIGLMRGKMADGAGRWTLGNTPVDVELAIALAMLGGGVALDASGEKKIGRHVLNIGQAIFTSYCSQVGRHYGKTGEFEFLQIGGSLGNAALMSPASSLIAGQPDFVTGGLDPSLVDAIAAGL